MNEAKYWRAKYNELHKARNKDNLRYEKELDRLFNIISFYRDTWDWLLGQDWYQEHIEEVWKHVEYISTGEERDRYGLKK